MQGGSIYPKPGGSITRNRAGKLAVLTDPRVLRSFEIRHGLNTVSLWGRFSDAGSRPNQSKPLNFNFSPRPWFITDAATDGSDQLLGRLTSRLYLVLSKKPCTRSNSETPTGDRNQGQWELHSVFQGSHTRQHDAGGGRDERVKDEPSIGHNCCQICRHPDGQEGGEERERKCQRMKKGVPRKLM